MHIYNTFIHNQYLVYLPSVQTRIKCLNFFSLLLMKRAWTPYEIWPIFVFLSNWTCWYQCFNNTSDFCALKKIWKNATKQWTGTKIDIQLCGYFHNAFTLTVMFVCFNVCPWDLASQYQWSMVQLIAQYQTTLENNNNNNRKIININSACH